MSRRAELRGITRVRKDESGEITHLGWDGGELAYDGVVHAMMLGAEFYVEEDGERVEVRVFSEDGEFYLVADHDPRSSKHLKNICAMHTQL